MESVRTDIPAELADTIRRMMSKDPAERFQTPTEVADALAPLVDRHRTGSAAPKGSKQGEVESHGYHPSRSHKRPLAHRLVVTVLLLFLLAALAASLIYVTTDKGTLQIRTNTYDVEVVVKQQGELVEIVDSRNGANLIRLRSGVYEVELKDDKDQFTLSKDQFTLRRGQRVIVDVKHVAEQPWHSTNKTPPQRHRYAFAPPDKTIAQDGIVVEEQGWRIDAPAPRTVRLFEVPMKDTHNGMLTYRARLKTKDIEGRAYLAMWVRFPGMGEFFSKGLHNAVRGTNDWSEYEIPFMLKKGQEPDLVKLNLEVEGTGTVWIKDVELRSVTSADVKEAPAVSDDPSPVIRDVGIERLLERSKAGSNAEREEVIDQLQDLGRNQFPVDATLALIRIARECADEEIAREATDAIAEIGEDNRAAAKIALPAMIALMNERNAPADVREGAVRALGEIGSKQPQLKEVKSCVPPLLELLDSDTPQFVEMALWSLREIGLADRSLVEPALPSIARMASESKNSKMRNAAADVIQRLNDSP